MVGPAYEQTLASLHEALAAHAFAPTRLPPSEELMQLVRLSAQAAVRENVTLEVLAADIGRIVAETLLGDPAVSDVARAMARGAAREFANVPPARGAVRDGKPQ